MAVEQPLALRLVSMMKTMLKRLLICVLFAAVFILLSTTSAADDTQTCTDPATCADNNGGVDLTMSPDEETSITITNQSPFRIDVYYDDNDYGAFITTLEENESTGINSYLGHSFFVTRHGVKEGLFANRVLIMKNVLNLM